MNSRRKCTKCETCAFSGIFCRFSEIVPTFSVIVTTFSAIVYNYILLLEYPVEIVSTFLADSAHWRFYNNKRVIIQHALFIL